MTRPLHRRSLSPTRNPGSPRPGAQRQRRALARHGFGLPVVFAIAAGILAAGAWAQPRSLGDETWTPFEPDQVRVGGEIGRRVDVTLENNLLVLNADKDFLAPFQRRDGQSGYVGLGKLIDAAVRLAAYSRDEKAVALKNHVVDRVIALQQPDGYLGMLAPEKRVTTLWDIHEVAYLVYGLVSDYRFFGREDSLTAARRGADYLVQHWHEVPPDWGHQTGVATHVAVTGLERAMLAVSLAANDPKYMKFCLEERRLREWNPEIVIGRRPLIEGHIYAYLCRSLAQLELYSVRRDERLLRPTDQAIQFMVHGDGLAITGGCGQWEIWTNDQDGRGQLGETCATAYQLRVYDQLLRMRCDPFYGDLMERTIYNTLFAAQSPDGRRIRYYSPLEGPREYHPTDTYCCPCNYRRIVAELPQMVYYGHSKGVVVNLYTPSELKMTLGGEQQVVLRQETHYPSDGHVTLRVSCRPAKTFSLMLRIPAWAEGTTATINGKPLEEPVRAGHLLTIERQWREGDRVELAMPMGWRLVRGRQRQAGRAAVMRGPLVFCLNPSQDEKLAEWDGADLGRIMLDPESLTDPLPDDSVRPGGIACRIQAWRPGYRVARPGDLTLVLTEFADPGGKAVYFRLPDLRVAQDDELLGPHAARHPKPLSNH